ncbi:CRISPR-associated protein Cas5 [Rhodococcus wratislaviensis]
MGAPSTNCDACQYPVARRRPSQPCMPRQALVGILHKCLRHPH